MAKREKITFFKDEFVETIEDLADNIYQKGFEAGYKKCEKVIKERRKREKLKNITNSEAFLDDFFKKWGHLQ